MMSLDIVLWLRDPWPWFFMDATLLRIKGPRGRWFVKIRFDCAIRNQSCLFSLECRKLWIGFSDMASLVGSVVWV